MLSAILALETLVAGVSIQQVKALVTSLQQTSYRREIHSLATEHVKEQLFIITY